MTVASAISVNQILNRVAVECGLDASQDPFGDSSQHYVQLKTLLQTACEDLALLFPWEFLVREQVITVQSGDDNEYDLPSDFLSIIDQTGWNRSTDEPLIGPLSAQEWQSIKSSTTEPIRYGFRIQGGKIYFVPDPPEAGVVLSYEYLSQNFATDDGGTEEKATFTLGSDIILFDRTLAIRYLKLKWLQAKGFDTVAAQNSVDQVYNTLTGKDKGGRILNAGYRSAYKYIDNTNIPLTGFGQ